ncbi:hypothetical protein [Sphingomonas sp. LHG3406-1]|uniref:hypothetical protein n=1 Tax=Sphingomonas sp. LHG3406-1 TaxID=2804617 RepID=UPI0026281804|nr:hypothetical protein [Sphingomonas sp. LHG3406-1]
MKERGRRRRWINRSFLAGGLLLLGSPLIAPQLLVFPHHAIVASHQVYSEQPIGPDLAGRIAEADARMLQSPLGRARTLDQPIFLTEGGWRWRWLAINVGDSFAISRPVSETVILNRADPARDLITTAGTRRLTDVLVHEFTHGAVRAHFGQFAAVRFPRELVEGYADHVAGSSSLTDAKAQELLRTGQQHPALLYWTGRRKVEAALARNGGSVQRLFEEWR